MFRNVARLALICGGVGTTSGAELVVRDLTMQIEALPTAFTYTAASDGFQRSGTDYFRTAFGVSLGAHYSLAKPGQSWGPIVGVDLAALRASSDTARLTLGEVRGVAGLAWQTDLDLVCVAQLSAGLGWGQMKLEEVESASTGQMGSLTPSLGLWWNSDPLIRYSFSLGWRMDQGAFHQGGTDIDTNRSGLCLAIGICWGLSRAPWSLE